MKSRHLFIIFIFLFACGNRPKEPVANVDGIETLNLIIPEVSQEKLDLYTKVALENKVISSDEKKYVSSYLVIDEDTSSSKLRLKGDWTDHLQTEKISYRIKLSGDERFYGLKTFSIQHPKTRNYLNEWFFHRMADMEGLLTTKYEFVNVNINDENKGIYALEEHFDKQLLESRNRREGPILKLNEDGTWAQALLNERLENKEEFPYFHSTYVSLFKKKRTFKSSTLKANFDEGKILLQLFLDGYLELDDLFDIDQLAKYYALIELSGFHHALRWHNRRFYYNPITQKLEHIVYDVLPFARDKEEVNMFVKINSNCQAEFMFDNAVILHEGFRKRFLYYYDKYSNPDFLDSIFKLLDPEINTLQKLIQQEEKGYSFNKNQFYTHAQFLRDHTKELIKSWDLVMSNKKSRNDWLTDLPYPERTDQYVLKAITLNAYSSLVDSSLFRLYLENYHVNPIEVLAVQLDSGSNYLQILNEPKRLNSFSKGIDSTSLFFNDRVKKVYFRAENNPENILEKKVIPWGKPSGMTSRMQLEHSSNNQSKFYKIENGTAFMSGRLVIDELVYVPEDYPLKISKGSSILFENGGGIIVSNSFEASGTAANPIEFICKDSSSQGITILNGDHAVFEYVKIDGLSNLNYQKWMLTGAVTVYETPVELNDVQILNALAEDALNIVRSSFQIQNLFIANCASDGFDADFCRGEISNSSFESTGNDCIDFSGSQVVLKKISIRNSGDKGVSAGERSTINLQDVSIDGCLTGLASKDQSSIRGEKINILHSEIAIMAFRKKGEYGPASVDVHETNIKFAEKEMLVDKSSTISLNGNHTEGEERLDVDSLYLRFE